MEWGTSETWWGTGPTRPHSGYATDISIPSGIPSDAVEWRDRSDYWILWRSTVCHNDKSRELKVDLWSLREGQTLGCMVSRKGELHVYIDGVDKGIVWTGLPTHKPFWGVADVHGLTTNIQLVSSGE